MLPKPVCGVAVDALDAAAERTDASASLRGARTPDLFLAAVAGARFHTAPAVGLGEDFRLASPGLTGAALVVNDTVVHLSALAQRFARAVLTCGDRSCQADVIAACKMPRFS